MSKPILIQTVILTLIVSIIFFSYKYLLDSNREKKLNTKEININQQKDETRIEELNYVSSDESGNIYKIFSETGEINDEDENLLLLQKVYAEITIKSETIYIYADNANYNKSNLNTHFYDNVSLIYEDYTITSDDIFLNYVGKEVKISNNVQYNDNNNKLNADIIDFDLITKTSKIYMIDKKKKNHSYNKKLNGNNKKI